MASTFHEVVVSGKLSLVKGLFAGFVAGKGLEGTIIYSEERGIAHETVVARIKELVHLSRDYTYLVVDEAGLTIVREAAHHAGHDLGVVIKHTSAIVGARFEFSFEVFGEPYAETIKRAIDERRDDVVLERYAPSEEHNATMEQGMYTATHRYIFEGEGRVKGPFEGVFELHQALTANPFVTAGDVSLKF